MHNLQECRDEVHVWDHRNRIEFDAAKAHFIILHPTSGVGDEFKLLDLLFDHKLHMIPVSKPS